MSDDFKCPHCSQKSSNKYNHQKHLALRENRKGCWEMEFKRVNSCRTCRFETKNKRLWNEHVCPVPSDALPNATVTYQVFVNDKVPQSQALTDRVKELEAMLAKWDEYRVKNLEFLEKSEGMIYAYVDKRMNERFNEKAKEEDVVSYATDVFNPDPHTIESIPPPSNEEGSPPRRTKKRKRVTDESLEESNAKETGSSSDEDAEENPEGFGVRGDVC